MSGIPSNLQPPTPILGRSGSINDLSKFPRRVYDEDSEEYVIEPEASLTSEKIGTRTKSFGSQMNLFSPTTMQPVNNELPNPRLRALSNTDFDNPVDGQDEDLEKACCGCAYSVVLLAGSFFCIKSKFE